MKNQEKRQPKQTQAHIEGAGLLVETPIVETLRENYMPYAMSVIVSRALPEIDGFKPSHRKLLYTMYDMGLLRGDRSKSANIVGQTMRFNPHGDQAIYETMVRLTRGNGALLHPFVDSKGNFGKSFSRDIAYAAARYTEAKLDAICEEVFADIEKGVVDFVPNYDNRETEPLLLPVRFPTILANPNVGIAVSMASNICSFNLQELCETTIAVLRDPNADILATLKAPDFPCGGYIVYDEAELQKIYDTGRGSVRVRSRYNYDKANNCVEVTEIPPTTTVEAIIDKIVELVKSGRLKELGDTRNETDKSGFKLTLDLKRGVDPDMLMQKLFKLTPLQDTFSCNFNILVGGSPRVMGVREILTEWADFRGTCIRRRVQFNLRKMREKLHLLEGLEKILLDIDKAIKIIRETLTDDEVVPNLMIAFGISEVQADYVAEIKLRHINREYILKRTAEIAELRENIPIQEGILKDNSKVKSIIIADLREIAKKYGKPRRSLLIYADDEPEIEFDTVPDYNAHLFLTAEGYFKKITPQSLRSGGDQKLKEGDRVTTEVFASNKSDLLFFTDKGMAYKSKVSEFSDTKASTMGDYLPSKLSFDAGERVVAMIVTDDYSGDLVNFFANGKAARVTLSSFVTKTNRRKLVGSLSDKSPLTAMYLIHGNVNFLLRSTLDRAVVFNTALLLPTTTRASVGVQVIKVGKGELKSAVLLVLDAPPESLEIEEGETLFKAEQIAEVPPQWKKYIVKQLPGAGLPCKDEEQGSLL